MSPLADALRDPIALTPNRPPRFYRGGRLLGAFRGETQADDDDRPEDWVGSATRTWVPDGAPTSVVGTSEVEIRGERITMETLLAREPEALVGATHLERLGATLGLLVKLLDAGERLPVHCHPTREAAAGLLGSAFGKTEAWLVLGTRGTDHQARVWAGFRDTVDERTLRTWIEEQHTETLLESLVEQPVAAGDVILVPGGTPHAIGAGVFLLELQEPTDFSIVAETRGFPISREDASLGLGWDAAIGFFSTGAAGELRQSPAELGDGVTRLLGPDADPFFRALRWRLSGERSLPIDPAFAVGIVLDGAGELTGARTALELRRGVTFALPAAAVAPAAVRGDGLEIALCLPPDPAALDASPLPAVP